ncbi:MAG: 16S rRNA (cytosine(1402)-N(4))-methyltransferase RsmH [Acidobacteriota bacterium]
MMTKRPDDGSAHVRRKRYSGRNPQAFHDKYKELNPEQYPAEVQKILGTGKTPAGMHVPIMVAEVLACLRPAPGEVAVDCTLGGGGHARLILERLRPGGRLIGLDLDPVELPRTEARLRSDGYGPDVFTARQANFAGVAQVLGSEGVPAADIVLVDLGVSSMQLDNPDRGFSYKGVGPLDMRMNPTRGEPASAFLARVDEAALVSVLREHADEPHAEVIASLLKAQPLTTTHATERTIRTGLSKAMPAMSSADIKISIRRTFQALRIAVNDEFSVLDAFLRALPLVLSPSGRAAIMTFHSGEDRRVKKAFQAGFRAGIYSNVATEVIRSSMEETRANRRASSAKLRWAVRSKS